MNNSKDRFDLRVDEDGEVDLVLDEDLESDEGLAVVEIEDKLDEYERNVEQLVKVASFLYRLRKAAATEDKEELGPKSTFATLVNEGMELAGLLDKDLAREFSCALPTIVRWTNGINAPHPFMRPGIYKWLELKVLER